MIRRETNYTSGIIVILISCETGKIPEGGGEPFAQKLANALGPGAIVKAPDDYIGIVPDGRLYIGPIREDRMMYLADPGVRESTNTSDAMKTFKGEIKWCQNSK